MLIILLAGKQYRILLIAIISCYIRKKNMFIGNTLNYKNSIIMAYINQSSSTWWGTNFSYYFTTSNNTLSPSTFTSSITASANLPLTSLYLSVLRLIQAILLPIISPLIIILNVTIIVAWKLSGKLQDKVKNSNIYF